MSPTCLLRYLFFFDTIRQVLYCTILCRLSKGLRLSCWFCSTLWNCSGMDWTVGRVHRPRSIRAWMAAWVGQSLLAGTKCHHAPSNLKIPHYTRSPCVLYTPFKLGHYWCLDCHRIMAHHNATMPHQKPLRHCSQSKQALSSHPANGAWLPDCGTSANPVNFCPIKHHVVTQLQLLASRFPPAVCTIFIGQTAGSASPPVVVSIVI